MSHLNSPLNNTAVIQNGAQWLLFTDPVRVLTSYQPEDVLPILQQVETAVEQEGLFAAGMLSYEASAAFGLTTRPPAPPQPPLIWFGLYKTLHQISAPPASASSQQFGEWQTTTQWPAYADSIARIKSAIAAGDTYQVNHTFPLTAPFLGNSWDLFWQMVQAQKARYTAYLNLDDYAICSASPELFFQLDGRKILSKPMKGTAPRGRTFDEDMAQAQALFQSEKNRAENVMIVDMIRNDMGRICEIGTIKVPHLFEIERYPTVLQMTSTVMGETAASLPEIMTAMFPCASITGAPKVRTMKMIADLESEPRGVYTGSIGYWLPGRQAQFNVAIRTVTLNKTTQMASYGVGGGIVWDSNAAEEFDECRVKARVVTHGIQQKYDELQLLETMLWTPAEGIFLLDEHMRRLTQSAAYFDIPLTPTAVNHHLEKITAALMTPTKIRLIVSPDGTFITECIPIKNEPVPEVAVGLAAFPIQSDNPLLYHKTSQREVYQHALASRPDCEEVLLWNERGEVTESDIANLVIEFEGQLLTPPLASGLLPGTFRAHLLANGHIQEQIITKRMLETCDHIYLINSVRRWRTGRFIQAEKDSALFASALKI